MLGSSGWQAGMHAVRVLVAHLQDGAGVALLGLSQRHIRLRMHLVDDGLGVAEGRGGAGVGWGGVRAGDCNITGCK